ncbi:hypothetical protein GO986_12400 [Deinococcus sp. HMF7620]|uniref:Uncharacterized protein n=2 Tax=Deinococcus arboris TaxID=2682977 RepID=A0A7C9HSH9_9DEIO|nr:hypothetical protein [Deinococcus betulae]MBZ9752179.1 hypothetical protein [Deinococcus betulae]MVN87567.1 hypothetical protein [Deinococcus arboris]
MSWKPRIILPHLSAAHLLRNKAQRVLLTCLVHHYPEPVLPNHILIDTQLTLEQFYGAVDALKNRGWLDHSWTAYKRHRRRTYRLTQRGYQLARVICFFTRGSVDDLQAPQRRDRLDESPPTHVPPKPAAATTESAEVLVNAAHRRLELQHQLGQILSELLLISEVEQRHREGHEENPSEPEREQQWN